MAFINVVLLVPAAHKETADAICAAPTYEGGEGTLSIKLTDVESVGGAENGPAKWYAGSGSMDAAMVAAVLAAGIGAESITLAGTNFNGVIAAHNPVLHRVVEAA